MKSNQESGRDRNRFQALAMTAVFDIAGPLVTYQLLRSAGQSTVSALILSGAFPALGIAVGLVRHRRVDTVGVLVLAGIAVGTILGLLSGNPRMVLIEGSVPTAVFGLLCLASLWSRRPLIYRFALEFVGADTPKGRDFAARWRYPGFRHAFRLFTVVWGVTYLAEALARVIVVETTSTATALTISKVMPYAVAALLAAWMVAYGRRARRAGEQLARAAASNAPADTDNAPADAGYAPADGGYAPADAEPAARAARAAMAARLSISSGGGAQPPHPCRRPRRARGSPHRDAVVMMFDAPPGWPPTPGFLRLYVEDADDVHRKAVAAGGTSVTEVTHLLFGDRVGRVRDPLGNVWWIQARIEEVSPQEMQRRLGDPVFTEAKRYVQQADFFG